MGQIQSLYLEFLNNFPENLRPVISIGLAILIIYSVFKIVKKDFIFIIVLIVLLPGATTILKSVWEGIVSFVKFLLNMG